MDKYKFTEYFEKEVIRKGGMDKRSLSVLNLQDVVYESSILKSGKDVVLIDKALSNIAKTTDKHSLSMPPQGEWSLCLMLRNHKL